MRINFRNGFLVLDDYRWGYHSTQREVRGVIKVITSLSFSPYDDLLNMQQMFNALLCNTTISQRDKDRITKKLALVEKEVEKWQIIS